MKRANGSGSVVKLSGNRRKPYAIRITVDVIDGKQIYEYVDYFATAREAEEELNKLCGTDNLTSKVKLTFKEVYNEWSAIAYLPSEELSKEIISNYKNAYKRFEPLHKKIFRKIRTAEIKTTIENATKDKKTKDKNGKNIIEKIPVSSSSKQKMKILAGLLYKYAMENDIVDKNYAAFVDVKKDKIKNYNIFTDLDLETLKKNDHIDYIDTILILNYSGFRINEMLSLTRFQVDVENWVFQGGLKTDAGKDRIVPIHPLIQGYIQHWYDKSSDYLFTRTNGKKLTYDYYTKYIYYPLLEKLGIERKTPHKARHKFGTLADKNNLNTNSIKEIMGHSDYAFTANTYTHADYEKLHEEIKKIK